MALLYTRYWTESLLTQVAAWRLFDTKPLSKHKWRAEASTMQGNMPIYIKYEQYDEYRYPNAIYLSPRCHEMFIQYLSPTYTALMAGYSVHIKWW